MTVNELIYFGVAGRKRRKNLRFIKRSAGTCNIGNKLREQLRILRRQ